MKEEEESAWSCVRAVTFRGWDDQRQTRTAAAKLRWLNGNGVGLCRGLARVCGAAPSFAATSLTKTRQQNNTKDRLPKKKFPMRTGKPAKAMVTQLFSRLLQLCTTGCKRF